jgi:hypothetical protein
LIVTLDKSENIDFYKQALEQAVNRNLISIEQSAKILNNDVETTQNLKDKWNQLKKQEDKKPKSFLIRNMMLSGFLFIFGGVVVMVLIYLRLQMYHTIYTYRWYGGFFWGGIIILIGLAFKYWVWSINFLKISNDFLLLIFLMFRQLSF